MMNTRSLYLAKYRTSKAQRAHFALFIPNSTHDRDTLTNDFRSTQCVGTIINVVGEPLMGGFALEIKRNHECSSRADLQQLIFLDRIDSANIYEPTASETKEMINPTPKGVLEKEAVMASPPPAGQNIMAPIDGISTKRCQEWTMEYLTRLTKKGLINNEAIGIAQSHRDPPAHGIFGQSRAAQVQILMNQQVKNDTVPESQAQ